MSFTDHVAALRAGRLLHVVNYHVTPVDQADRLERELSAYLEHLDPVLPEHLDAYFSTGRWPLARPGFAPVFYDGYREHASVAAPVCERLGIVAWFLPPTGFLDCPVAEQVDFCERHDMWLPVEPHPDGRLALTWDELAGIGRRHVLGGHTASHAVPSDVMGPDDVERELAQPYAKLSRAAGRAPVAMAWRLGVPDQPEHPAFQAVRAMGYRYLISATKVQRVAGH